MPQRSRRLSASGIGLGILKWEDIFAPQRSRRLSASGIRQREHRARAAVRASKKQTPFSVWYSSARAGTGRRTECLKEADAFQRLVSGSPRALRL